MALFGIKLVPQAGGTEIKRTARFIFRRVPLGTIMKAPAGGPAGDSTSQIGEEISRRGLPGTVSAPKGLLVKNGHVLSDAS